MTAMPNNHIKFFRLSWKRACTLALLLLLSIGQPLWASTPLNSSSNKTENIFASAQATKAPEFLPVEKAYRLTPSIRNGQLLLSWQITDGYYLYRPKFAIDATIDGKALPLSLQFPEGIIKHDEYFGEIEVYYQQADILARNIPEQNTLPSAGELQFTITSQGCADAGLCYPPYKQHFSINLSTGDVTPIDPTNAPTANDFAAISANIAQKNIANTSFSQWLAILTGAFLGGLILNLMPCVFPVLGLKVLSFLRDEKHSHALHGFSYTAGIIISFVAIAALLLGLRAAGSAIGWGFQLQSPWFVGLMVYLFFVLALNLSGVFEIGGSWMNSGGRFTQAPGYGGSFATGLLATLVASPCTAPFMGAALGFAITQPTAKALLVFIFLGLGMAAPVLVMSLSPQLLKRLPKPGAWMQTLKQIMAFPLYATALWLAWVLGNQTGINGLITILTGCLLLALAIVVWPRGKTGMISAWIVIVTAAYLPFSSFFMEAASTPRVSGIKQSNEMAQPWSAERLEQLRKDGTPVFVDVTADWCITCLANEKLVLNSEPIKKLFAEKGIVYLKADWTRYDAAITNYLGQFGRNGVPLYVFYPANNDKPLVLPQILQTDAMLGILNSPK
jgi:thiol:disulfide interchange protein